TSIRVDSWLRFSRWRSGWLWPARRSRRTSRLRIRCDETSLVLALTQPFVENDLSFIAQNALIESGFLLAILCFVWRLSFFQNGNYSTVFPRKEITHVARLDGSDRIPERDKVRRLILWRVGGVWIHIVHQREG